MMKQVQIKEGLSAVRTTVSQLEPMDVFFLLGKEKPIPDSIGFEQLWLCFNANYCRRLGFSKLGMRMHPSTGVVLLKLNS
jgi:hypothetical protein